MVLRVTVDVNAALGTKEKGDVKGGSERVRAGDNRVLEHLNARASIKFVQNIVEESCKTEHSVRPRIQYIHMANSRAVCNCAQTSVLNIPRSSTSATVE